jgi:membrane protease subunit HflK
MLGLWVLAAVMGLSAVMTMVYTIPAESQGVVLRFGRFVRTVDSGLHFKLPFRVEIVEKVQVKRQLKQEFGFGTPGGDNKYQYSKTEQELEKSMVTGDLNEASVEWIVQFRIQNPSEYLFKVRSPDETLRDASETVMREVVGDRTVDEVITVGRQEIEAEALAKLQVLVKKYELGLIIDQVQLKNVNPPQPVQASFNEVNQAQQERERLVNVANGEYNKAVPRARGEANQKLQAAEGYALRRVNEAKGDAARFEALFLEYRKAPEVTEQRIYLETMEEILPKLGKKIIIDEKTGGLLPLLQLNTDNVGTERRKP